MTNKLPWDVARCTGENSSGKCADRNICLRFVEFKYAAPHTLKFEAPTDAPLKTGCELMITVHHDGCGFVELNEVKI